MLLGLEDDIPLLMDVEGDFGRWEDAGVGSIARLLNTWCLVDSHKLKTPLQIPPTQSAFVTPCRSSTMIFTEVT